MIYLIKSPYCDWSDSGELAENFRVVYKIGFTDSLDSRLSGYTCNNPGYKLLYVIPGTQDHEKRLHYKFREFKLDKDNLKEWFEESSEILEFFKSSPKIEDLDKLPKSPSREDFEYKKRRKEVRVINSFFFDDPEKASKYFSKVSESLGDLLCRESYFEFIRKDGEISSETVDRYLRREEDLRNGKLEEELTSFIAFFRSLTTIYDKLKALCESDKSIVEKSLQYFPPSDLSIIYFNRLGASKLKALYYNVTKVRELIELRDFDKSTLPEHIYGLFNEGDKLSLSIIKDKLKTLYSKIGYKATPKATDLEEYFEVKKVSLYKGVVDGKKIRPKGYLLLKKKS